MNIRERVREFIDKPYRCNDRRKGCVLFVLAMVAPFSDEYSRILERVRGMKKFVPDRAALSQDYLRKFIRTTNLRYVRLNQSSPGDLVLLNIRNVADIPDHLGVCIGDGEYAHLQCGKREDIVRTARIDDDRRKILGIVRAIDYGPG